MRVELDILKHAEQYVSDLIQGGLPSTMLFHNMKHTYEVSQAASEISSGEHLSADERFVIQLAAIFHDCGYVFKYSGHEESSMEIAAAFLAQQPCPIDVAEAVVNCIAATKVPQYPKNHLEQVICDADLHHFAKADYLQYAERLKAEWAYHLNKEFDALTWNKSNLEILINHQYFTTFAQNSWQPRKQLNIEQLKRLIAD